MDPIVFRFEAIGTSWQIDIPKYPSLESKILQDHLLTKIKNRIDIFDKDYSRFREDSLVTQISKKAGSYTLPSDAEPLLNLYTQLFTLTNGAFTPLIGETLVQAGYDSTYSFKQQTLTPPSAWDKIAQFTPPTLTLSEPALLDVGAAGKGHLIDIIGELLEQEDVHDYCIDAGGDILYKSTTPNKLRVGLENPENTNQVVGITTIHNESICGSAGNRRKWDNFHHIIDPLTLQSPQHISATWAIASTTILADALSTCLFFTSAQTLLKHFRFEYLILYSDYSIESSPRFPANVFTPRINN